MNYLDAKNKPAKETFDELSKKIDRKFSDVKFCDWLDENDELAHLRNEFVMPTVSASEDEKRLTLEEPKRKACLYFSGNSLGLQPKNTVNYVEKVLKNWRENNHSCHFIGFLPGAWCGNYVVDSMAKIVGGNNDEVVAMNGLTVNLHLLLVSFYQPTTTRHKILIEQKAFPSDHYAVESQIRQRGFDPETSMLLMKPREGEETWRQNDILELIEKEGESIALVMLPGVHYYTGQLFDIEAITKIAHKKGCFVGFDLAHAAGNVELYLHDWQVDFACWCSYKYLNSGPGGTAGAFLHRKYGNNNFNKFLGWWGHKLDSRFEMSNVMDLSPGIQGYKLSNQSPLLIACCRASLDIFDKVEMATLRGKSVLLTGYLEMLLKYYFSKGGSTPYVDIITPADYRQRGCQLSLKFSCSLSEVYEALEKEGVVCDVRQPNVIRIAPVPLYNSFRDVYQFVEILRKILV